MRVEILGGPFDGQVYRVDHSRDDVLVALPKEGSVFDLEGEALGPFERYRLPVREGKAYWNERTEVL